MSLQTLHDLSDLIASAFGEGWLLALVVLLVAFLKKIGASYLSPYIRRPQSKKIPIVAFRQLSALLTNACAALFKKNLNEHVPKRTDHLISRH
jgi:hypothetical protein